MKYFCYIVKMWLLFTLVLILVYLYFASTKRKSLNYLDNLPEPPGRFFWGHGFEVNSTTKILSCLYDYTKQYGTIVKVRLGPIHLGIVSADQNFNKFILSSNTVLTKTFNYGYLKPWLGNGLLVSKGSYWRKHRKILTPAFHFEILKEFVDIFESVGNVFVEKLKKYDGATSVDLHPLVSLCTLDVICETAMDTKINAQLGENSEYVRCVHEMCRICIERLLSLLKLSGLSFWLTKDYYIQNRALKTLHGFTLNVINTKRQNKKTHRNSSKMAFLDLMLKFSDNGKLLSNEEIREEVDTFMFEGHDTLASGICFALYCLAKHPDIQEKAFREQKALFGDEKNPPITHQELQNMKYLECVIKETLRLYPSVPIIGRCVSEDIEFEGRVIPKTTSIAVFIYGVHRNPEYFPDPEKFNPDRFWNVDNLPPYVYIPFSAGPRNCIGQKFAMLEMKSIISKVLRHFEIQAASPQHELMLSVEIVLKSINGVKIGLKKRV